MQKIDPNKTYRRLSTNQRNLILCWLDSDFLTEHGKKVLIEILDVDWYNEGDEKNLLNSLRVEWVKSFKKNKET